MINVFLCSIWLDEVKVKWKIREKGQLIDIDYIWEMKLPLLPSVWSLRKISHDIYKLSFIVIHFRFYPFISFYSLALIWKFTRKTYFWGFFFCVCDTVSTLIAYKKHCSSNECDVRFDSHKRLKSKEFLWSIPIHSFQGIYTTRIRQCLVVNNTKHVKFSGFPRIWAFKTFRNRVVVCTKRQS